MDTVALDARKRLFAILVTITAVVSLLFVTACGASTAQAVKPDFADAASFEAALNNGDDLTGKTVQFEVKELVPNSALGYNLQAGEHLNFVSSDNPGVKAGDKPIVRVVKVASALGSWMITYEKV